MEGLLTRAGQAATARLMRVQQAAKRPMMRGAGMLLCVPRLLKHGGFSTVMVVTTKGFVQRGTLTPFLNALGKENIRACLFTDVAPDPDTTCVENAAAFYRSNKCQAIVAIGGGSVIDCAKVAGALAVHPRKKARDLVGTMKVARPVPFMIAVPTTAGTGSEVTAAAVITDVDAGRKLPISDLMLVPNMAVLDPELLAGLSPEMTAYTGMDALTHAVEAYLNRYCPPEAQQSALRAVELIAQNLKGSYDDGANLALRESMLVASYCAGKAFTNAFVGYVHALAHAVGGRYHVQHGLANAVLLPYVLEEYGTAIEPQLADLARAAKLEGDTDGALARSFIAWVRELAASMGIPSTLDEIRDEDVSALAAAAESEGNPTYPVPVVWKKATFEKVLRRAQGGSGEPAEMMAPDSGELVAAAVERLAAKADTRRMDVADRQIRMEPGPLLGSDGKLAAFGYATSLVREYDRSRIKSPALRIKEWDYYLVQDDEYAVAFTIGDLGFAAMISASLLDFKRGTFNTQSTLGVLPLGRLHMPWSTDAGVSEYVDKRANLRFEVADGVRRLSVTFNDFEGGKPFTAAIVLTNEPQDSMVIATPWADNDRAFYYNQKIVGMRASGRFQVGDLRHEFGADGGAAFGLLDWGRGVWTYDNTWFWSAAQGMQHGHVFGFNLGYGFGNTAAASENMLFVDGVAHKLGRLDFGIPVLDAEASYVGDRFDLMKPWHITDDDGRVDLTFTPQIDRCDYLDFKAVISDQHQVFGLFNGAVVLDDGSIFEIRNLRGFAEAVHNRY